ncbi:MAG: hypothetical protein J0H43_05160 [Actinobacteria bacterium]|nr:hypothetical protein [Actinomycetota bacterium]
MTAPRRPRRFLPGLDISLTQVIATALAAVTATIGASFLGVAGTVVGAAVASVLSVVGNAVYSHSLRRTQDRVREAVPSWPVGRLVASDDPTARIGTAGPTARIGTAAPPVLPAAAPRRPVREPRPARTRRPGERSRWRAALVGSVAMFVVVSGTITGVELVAGRPLSDIVRGDGGTGTSVFGDTPGSGRSTPQRTVTRTASPTVVTTTPTVTRTAAPTTEPASSPSAPPSTSAEPTPSTSPTPSETSPAPASSTAG